MVDIQLVFQNDKPRFFQDSRFGRRVHIGFGDFRYDDFYRSIIEFDLILKNGDTGWSVVLDEDPKINDWGDWYDIFWQDGKEESYCHLNDVVINHFLEPKAKVLQLVDECYNAILARNSFSFAEYIQDWQQWDKYFGIYVA